MSKDKTNSKDSTSGPIANQDDRLADCSSPQTNKDDVHCECSCSDQDYVRLIASNSSVLCKTILRWQESYNLDVTDLKEKALRLMKGDFRDLYGDLNPEEQEKIEGEIARLQRERTELLMSAIGLMTDGLANK